MALYGKQMTVCYFAVDTATGLGKTGDSANHTLRWVKDGTSAAPSNAASEVDSTNCPGIYKLTLTATETQCPFGVLAGKSSTSGIAIAPLSISFERLPDADPGSANGVLIAGTNAATTFTSAAGSALTLSSTGANGSGLAVSGNGSGHGISATGGATGNGVRATGGATSGAGIYSTASGASNYGIEAVGTGATDSGGIKATATTAGEGGEFSGAGNGHGLYVVGAGTGEGMHVTGGTGNTGDGAVFEAGSSATNGAGLRILGAGTGQAHGLYIARGAASGDDIYLANSDAPTLIVGGVAGNVTGSVASVTAAVTLPSIPAGWITAAGITAEALNGKGDWLLSGSYTAPDNVSIAAINARTDLIPDRPASIDSTGAQLAAL